jgi:hypothetical protein
MTFWRLSYTARMRATASSPSFERVARSSRWTKLLALIRKFKSHRVNGL